MLNEHVGLRRATWALTLILVFLRATGAVADSEGALAAPTNAQSFATDEVSGQPATAEAALKQAEAAYEYGDLPLMVESARLVTDGILSASTKQRAFALRLLGIGLYVTGRHEGAHAAFETLLRVDPEAQLDAATTRPEIVTFFYELRRRRLIELREQHHADKPSLLWAFVPPAAQFLSGDTTKAWILLVAEAATLITATTTYAILKTWEQPDESVCPDGLSDEACISRTATAKSLRSVYYGSSALFAAVYAYGVIDALVARGREPTERELLRRASPRASLRVLPNGAALALRF